MNTTQESVEVSHPYRWVVLLLSWAAFTMTAVDRATWGPAAASVGESLGVEPYGVGIKKGAEDLVRFVNGALAAIRADGTWGRLYDTWLHSLGPSPGPPSARYQD